MITPQACTPVWRIGALQLLGVLQRVADQRIVRLLFLYQLGNFLVGLGESGPGLFGYQFRDAVALREGQLLYAGDVLDRGFRRHRAERDDLCDALAAVLLDHVVQHVGAAVLVEIDVHVRKRNPVGIQEDARTAGRTFIGSILVIVSE